MQVILAPARIPVPGRSTKDREPVIGRGSVRFGVGPDIPVGFRVIEGLSTLGKPRVLVRCMAQHQIDHHFQPKGRGSVNHCIKIRERPEHRVHIAVIGHIIAKILHRRSEKRRNPNRVDPKRGDIRQALHDAQQIADTVPVTVLKRARIDLIDHRAAPPFALNRWPRIWVYCL